jgi:hypothetical protein
MHYTVSIATLHLTSELADTRSQIQETRSACLKTSRTTSKPMRR